MPRSLRFSPRPFIAIGIVLSPLVIIWGIVLVQKGFRSDLIFPALLPFLLYGAIMATICSRRVVINEEGITVISYFIRRIFIPFSEIQGSEIQILAERGHPLSLSIYLKEESSPAATLNLKPFLQEDVAWLCSLPELKIHTFSGLTD